MVTGKSYGDEIEIQYFMEKETQGKKKYWVLKENDFDSRERNELRKVTAILEKRDYYTFE